MGYSTLYVLALTAVMPAGWMQVKAQTPGPPQTYSFVAASEMFGPMTLKVNRNGPKELVESTSNSGGLHLRQLYDFQAHKVYSLDLQANRCTAQEYVSPYAPSMHDPIGAVAEIFKDGPPPRPSGTETVNGIATRVAEAALPDGRGKYKYWLEEKFNIPVKLALAMGNQPERVLFEIRQLSYAPSPASLFTPPPDCTAVAGVTSATGGHAEVKEEVKVTATHQLGQPGVPSAKVTAVRLRLVPETYTGPCPSRVQLVGDITTSGAGTVWYQFLAGAVKKSGPSEGTLSFSAAGTQSVTMEADYIRTPAVPHTSLLAAIADENGRRGPQNVTSGPVKYNATCTGQAPAARK